MTQLVKGYAVFPFNLGENSQNAQLDSILENGVVERNWDNVFLGSQVVIM